MGTEELHEETAEPQAKEEASYDIISFPGASLPDCYKGLVFSRWLRSHRYGNMWFKMVDSEAYYKQYGGYISLLLSKPETEVRLAVLSDDHDVVLGFCVHRDAILDYVHVQFLHRQQRIASKLVPNMIKCITHYTYMGSRFVTQRFGGFVFNPFA